MSRTIRLITDGFAHDPALDTAVSRAVLLGVDDGSEPETLRIHRPGDVVAFGRQDATSPGYHSAVEAAQTAGFTPIERLAGGRAAVFHAETIAFSWAIPEASPKDGITERFVMLGEIVVSALRTLGVDAGIGEVPGEYCPGTYSVHARGERKLVGTGQRLTRRAAHVGGVVVVGGREVVNRVLTPVYRELGLGWQPAATGDIVSEQPDTTWDTVRRSIIDAFRARFELVEQPLPAHTLRRARELAPEHIPSLV